MWSVGRLAAVIAIAMSMGFAGTTVVVRAQYAAPAAADVPDQLFRDGGAKVAFPEGYAKGVLYTVVDRPDIKQVRELYATPDAVAAARKGEPIPSGSVLTLVQYMARLDDKAAPLHDVNGRFVKGELLTFVVMEKRTGWGIQYPEAVRNGEWEYQTFSADGKVNQKANLRACFDCHVPLAGQDFVISLARLSGKPPMAARQPLAEGPGTVLIRKFAFGPAVAAVAAGQPVTWVNLDASPHQIAIKAKGLRTRLLHEGEVQALEIGEPGVYEYACGIHPQMKGSLEVRAAASK